MKLNDINKTLNQLISELHEASGNEFKAMKLEMEAMKADKAMKDEQLSMLYTVIEHHLGIDVHTIYNNIEIKRVEERWIERERRLAEEATQRKKEIIVETQEAGGSSRQVDVEMVDAEVEPKGFYVQQKIEYFLNDEINEQEEDQHQESSSSGKQHADQIFLTQPTVIYLHAQFEGELEVPRSRADMLEELGLDDRKFKFDIEDEIPPLPEREYEFKYAQEADKYNEIFVEDTSDSSDEETDFHYAGIDETFLHLLKCLKIIMKTISEGRLWNRSQLKYFTHDVDLSWGDILSWGYLEDLQVYAIRREQGVQFFEFLSDIKTLPWWDVDELVKTKNIKQFYHGQDVKQHDQHLWNYVKQQAKARYPDWKPQYPKQIVTILENGEKDITFDIKPPRCLKNMPLRAMVQDFYEDFQGWLYNESTGKR
ncbi:hypothetical protein Hanom_Chr08g00753211 [Helianthus anomalus]